MNIFKKSLSYIFYAAFVLAFVWISGQLFFEDRANSLKASVTELFKKHDLAEEISHLKIIYPDEPAFLEPTLTDPTVRQRLNNIYEPLVKPDRDLTMKPALALSWGLLDETTWDFRLRPDVHFHDGSKFTVRDVVASLNRAKKHEDSQVVGLLGSIESIDVVGDLRLRINTRNPDPLLLQRLASVLIIPEKHEEEDGFLPVGTGSYKFEGWERGDKIKLKRFDEYWGEPSEFEEVTMFSRLNKNERVLMYLNGYAHFLAFVPFDGVDVLEERGFEIAGMPSLEVQFLIFNTQSEMLDTAEKRRVVSLVFDQEGFIEILGEFAYPISQFVSNGVFGFNPNIELREYNLDKASVLADETGLYDKTLSLHIPAGLTVLGEHMRKQLAIIGVKVVVSYLDQDEFLRSMREGIADIYFLGYRASRGDSADFYDVVVHSEADFNVANYKNEEVDFLIERSFMEMDPFIRLLDLQEIMRIIVEEDIIGIPLFEYDTLYSFVEGLDFKPRIDGFIYFDEIKTK